MRLESLQIDFECTCNPERTHIRFYFGNSLLILNQSRFVRTLCKFAFQFSESPVQLIYTTNVEPSVIISSRATRTAKRSFTPFALEVVE
jgi:hypothetical protein